MPESSENEALSLVSSTAEIVEAKRKQKTVNLLTEDMVETCSKNQGQLFRKRANRKDSKFKREKNTSYKSALTNSVLARQITAHQ